MVLCIRLSLEDSKYDSLSIENQRLILSEFALSLPEAENAEIREFVDNGYSGTNFERPAIQELLELVRANKLDCVIVKDFSRFGRNSLETGYFIERVFPLFHTRFISVSDDFDSNNYKGDTGGMEVAFKYLINEYYSRDMSVKTKSAKYAKMELGEYQGKICPYGYRKSADGRMEPDPETAEVVKLIFQLAGAGNTAAAIARHLTAQHIPTPGEYKAAGGNRTYDVSRAHGVWSSSTILRMLDDERYTGTYVMGKRSVVEVGSNHVRLKDRDKWTIIPDHHPAIVDRATFDAANEKLTRFKLPNKKPHEHPLRGKVFCGCCRHALSRTSNKTSYYICRHAFGIEDMDCNGLKVSAKKLEQAIFETLKSQVELICPDGVIKPMPVTVKQSADYEQQLSGLQERKMRLYERYVSGELDADTYKQEKAAVDVVILQTKNACDAILTQAKREQERHEEQVQRSQIVREISTAEGLTQELADLLIDRVYVYPDGHLDLCYKVTDIFSEVI